VGKRFLHLIQRDLVQFFLKDVSGALRLLGRDRNRAVSLRYVGVPEWNPAEVAFCGD